MASETACLTFVRRPATIRLATLRGHREPVQPRTAAQFGVLLRLGQTLPRDQRVVLVSPHADGILRVAGSSRATFPDPLAMDEGGWSDMYDTKLTSVLSGASVRQLQFWRKDGPSGPLLLPEYGVRPRCLYSFRDVIALRMFVHLRQSRSLQMIRKSVQWMADQRPGAHMSENRLIAGIPGRGIFWLTEDGEWVETAENPGQGAIRVVMEDIFAAFDTEDGKHVPELLAPRRGLRIDPDRCSGIPTVGDSRIPYNLVGSLAVDGMTNDQIRIWYPPATDEQIRGALELSEAVRAA